jgi:hypothetical protein
LLGSFSVRETVMTDTPARRATSRIRELLAARLRLLRFASDMPRDAPVVCGQKPCYQ